MSVFQHHGLSPSPTTARCPFYDLSTLDDRTKQIAKHVEHAQSARETTTPTHATLTSTSANPAATLAPEVSLDRYLSVVLVRRRQPRPLYARHLSAYLLFAGLQKDGDKDTPATMLRDVMRGMFVPPTTT